MSFIFATSTYAIGYKLPEDLNRQLTAGLKVQGIRFLNFQDVSLLKEDLSKIKYLLGFFTIDGDELKAESNLWETYNDLMISADSSQPASTENVQDLIGKATSLHLPKRLDELAAFSANFIQESLFPSLNLSFEVTSQVELDEYDMLVQCDTSAPPFTGRCILQANIKRMQEKYPEFAEMNEALQFDSIKEFINQYLGVVNHNLMETGLSPKIGLPNLFHFEEAVKLKKTGLYIPYVNIIDENDIFLIRVGFVNSENQVKLNLDDMEFCSPDDEVDFL